MESTQNKTRCPHSKKCGGCQLQNLDYKEQLAHKERTCIRLLGKFCRVEPIIGMENPYHYRNKVRPHSYHACRTLISAFTSQHAQHVAVDSCMTEDGIADRIIVDIRRLLRDFKMTTYNEVTGRGFCAMCSSSAAFRPAKSWLCSSPVRRSSPRATISPVRC